MSFARRGALRRGLATLAFGAGLAGLLLVGTATAGDVPPGAPVVAASAKDPDHADTDLNAGVAASNDEAARREADNRRAFEEAQQRYLNTVNQRLNDEVARQADYARRMDAWRAAVAACQAGDTTQCGSEQPKP